MLRSINQAYNLIKEKDPNTCIKIYTLRIWCKDNMIKTTKVGNKTLIFVEDLFSFIGMEL